MTASGVSLSADRPIGSAADDRLGRKSLATLIAREIEAAPADDGFVIALMGAWGAGKTSVLNMVEEALDPKAIVVRFNPWMFSGTEQLVGRFFIELSAQLATSTEEAVKTLGDRVAQYGGVVAPVFEVVLGARGKPIAEFVSAGARAQQEPKPIAQQYDELRESLLEAKPRIVVMLDDIDRLEAHEVREVVRLVKLVGDLPGVVYLLAFDRPRVEAALADDVEGGRQYLEKIVQLSHDLPVVPATVLRRMALDELKHALGDRELAHFDELEWQNLFVTGVGAMFTTMRDARRWANVVPAALDLLGDEIAAHDLLALEALRLFEPDFHAELPRLADILTASRGIDLRDASKIEAEHRSIIAPALDTICERRREDVCQMLALLFPRAAHLFGQAGHGADRSARRRRKVADSSVLALYLAATIGEDAVATATVYAAIEAARNPPEFAALLTLLTDSQVQDLIERLRDHREELETEAPADLIRVLTMVEPRLRGRAGLFAPDPSWYLGDLARTLARGDGGDIDADVVVAVMDASTSLSERLRLLRVFAHRADDKETLSVERTDELFDHLAARVVAADISILRSEPTLGPLLSLARDRGDSDLSEAKLLEVVEDDVALLALIVSARRTVRHSAGYTSAVKHGLDWSGLAALVGADRLAERVKELEHPDDERARETLELARRYAAGDDPLGAFS